MEILLILLIFLVLLIVSLIWMKWRMRVSKGRFALATISTLATCLFASLSLVSTGTLSMIASQVFEQLSWGGSITVYETFLTFTALIITAMICYFIYQFANTAIANWEAPQRVSELELEKDNLQNSILVLTFKQIQLLAKRQSDPIASEYATSWDKKFTKPPKSVEARILLRDLFTACIREANLPDEGWRDKGKLWVGEIYIGIENDPKHLVVIVFEEQPTKEVIAKRLEDLSSEKIFDPNMCLYGVYFSDENKIEMTGTYKIQDRQVELLSSRQMIFESLDLRSYARTLLKMFNDTKAGGTDVTIANTYVELDAHSQKKDALPQPLNKVLATWINDTSRRHLAITGEYGQGKSTAMQKYCYEWAETFLKENKINGRVPLLIELRGRNPGEEDPLTFISPWCSRYGLQSKQVLNLIKTGDAIVIFEGFDELKNSGRAYDRHQHFNALWRFAYPKTKLIFTGRPNFFLDDREANRTLRSSEINGAAGEAYTEIWRLEKLNKAQITQACRNFQNQIKTGIANAIDLNPDFLDIVSRPSMLPVVATIWDEIENILSKSGGKLTSALLIERYLQAIYTRKEAELEHDRVLHDAPAESRYLELPRPVRELMTICVAWKMAGIQGQNTISRNEINIMVRDIYDDLFAMAKAKDVSPIIANDLIKFEKRHTEETLADKIELITNEICSAGLLVPDPVGGSTNLKYPHKQFYEYLICKGFCILKIAPKNPAAKLIFNSSNHKGLLFRLKNEPNSISYLSECIGQTITGIFSFSERLSIKFIHYLLSKLLIQRKSKFLENEFLENESPKKNNIRGVLSSQLIIRIITPAVAIFMIISALILSANKELANIINAIFYLSFFILSICLLITFGFMAGLMSKRLGTISKVFNLFLSASWSKAGQKPKDQYEYSKLALKTLLEGKVQFPNTPKKDLSDINNFLGPAHDFGKVD